MGVKPNLKPTEVGLIPEDWHLCKLGEIGNFKNGINKESTSFGHGSPFINLMDVFGSNAISTQKDLGLVKTSRYEQNIYDLRSGDVLFIRSSVKPSGVGLTVVVEKDLPKTVFSGFLIRYRENNLLDIYFKKYCFYEEGFRKRIISASTVSANTNINQDNLKRTLIAFPNEKREQQLIAEALSDADAWIEELEQLIAKKRQIKLGAMQEMLQNKKGWGKKYLGEIAHVQTGSRNNQDKIDDGKYPFFVRSDTVERINTFSYDCEAILIPGEGNIGNIFHYISGRFDVHQRVYAITQFNEQVFGKYIFFFMVQNFGKHALQNSVKATVDSLRLPTFQNFEISIPPTIEVQIDIINTLSDMDSEIAALEETLAKAKQIKQGMMQELLTGRIRLV